MTKEFEFSGRNYEFLPYVDCLNWIGGEWTEAQGGEWLDVENPRHGKVMGRVTVSGTEDIAKAVAAASAAAPGWKATPLKERAQILYRLKQLMERDLDELAWLLSHENGKTIAQALGDVKKGIECVEFGCSIPNLAAGEQLAEDGSLEGGERELSDAFLGEERLERSFGGPSVGLVGGQGRQRGGRLSVPTAGHQPQRPRERSHHLALGRVGMA